MQIQQNVQMTKRNAKTLAEWGVLIALLLSFVFLGIFEAFKFGNGRGVVASTESQLAAYLTYVAFFAVIGWLLFELVMRLYYFFVSMSIYVFVVPKRKAYYTMRMAWACRNVFVAAISLLLFASPIFVNYLWVITLIIDFFAIVITFLWLKKKYFGNLLAPFAWKAFLRPFIIYEIVMLIVEVVMTL